MSAATFLTGIVATVVGLVASVLGFTAISAGRGGFGYGPFPMVRQPTEWDLIAIGVALVVVGSVISGAGLTALEVM